MVVRIELNAIHHRHVYIAHNGVLYSYTSEVGCIKTCWYGANHYNSSLRELSLSSIISKVMRSLGSTFLSVG